MTDTTMTDEERLAFLAAYEELGPGGLTVDEIIELAELRAKASGVANDPDDEDSIGDIQTDVQYFMKKLIRAMREGHRI